LGLTEDQAEMLSMGAARDMALKRFEEVEG